ncbi:MAG: ABC transporter substrate-binding protein [Chlorobi bacterium]|nr:ABC transporter substrate-binding protein [Chlorobiota bacterium]
MKLLTLTLVYINDYYNTLMLYLRSILSLICLCGLLLHGCGSGDASETTTQNDSASSAKRYGGIFRLNVLRGDPNGLDPVVVDSKHADDIASQIYDKLIDLNDSLKLVPELARSWEISDDGRLYTFNLRTDAYFQDHPCFPDGKGRLMTANDVKYSLTRCVDPDERTKAYWAFQGKVKGATEFYDAAQNKKRLNEVAGFKVVNDSTFQIELVEPYAPFIYLLVNSLGSVVPREAVEMYGQDFRRNPVGTGPFKFDQWIQSQHVLLTRNANYWGKDKNGNQLPFLDSIKFTFTKDDNTQYFDFMAGHLDELFNIPTEQFRKIFDAETLELNSEFVQYKPQSVPAMLTWYFGLNNVKAPFNDANTRRAFNYAIDRARIVKFVLNNSPYAPAVHGLTPPVFPDYPIDSIRGYDYDPQKARELLAAAGYDKGEGFPSIALHIYDEPRLRQVAEAIQAQLREALNIDVEIKQMAFPQLIDEAESGKIEFWGTRWYGDYPDPETYLNLLNGQIVPDDPNVPSNPNSSRYDNPEYNALFNDAVRTIDYLARMAKYLQAEQLAMDDAPVMPLFYERHYRLLQPWVRDMKLDPMARYDLKRVWLDTPETVEAAAMNSKEG